MRQEEVWDDFYSKNGRAWRGSSKIPVPNEGKALDLGCGSGKTVSTLIEDGYDVTGVDFSSVAVDQCRTRFPGLEFVVASVCDMPFDDSSFDYVTSVHVLEHLDDDMLKSTVSEIGRILKPGGYVFVRCFTANDMRSSSREKSDIFYRFYDQKSIESAFEGFDVVSSELKEEETRFGTIRSRVEVLLLRPVVGL